MGKVCPLDGELAHQPSVVALKRFIADAEVKFNTKIYIDSQIRTGTLWTDRCVYLHGDRNVVNLICLKLVRWQHLNLKVHDLWLFAFPVEEMK